MTSDSDSSEQDNKIDPTRIFRRERIISEADLRLDVARQISRNILGNEDITLDTKEVRTVKSGATISRGGRKRSVTGSYIRTLGDTDSYMLQSSFTEKALGGVLLKMALESEAIVGGTYTNAILGGYLRVAAWCDFLAWGAWLEADMTRTEISGAVIRSYALHAQAVASRITLSGRLVDDFIIRNETFGALVDNTTSVSELGPPGSGTILET